MTNFKILQKSKDLGGYKTFYEDRYKKNN